MERKILILAIADVGGNIYVVGLDHEYNLIRIVDNSQTQSNAIHYTKFVDSKGTRPIKPFDLVGVRDIIPSPTKLQPENYTITDTTRFTILGAMKLTELPPLISRTPKFSHISVIYNRKNFLFSYEIPNETHSIEIIKVHNLRIYNMRGKDKRIKTKADFIYNKIWYKNFAVIDKDVYNKELYVDAAYIVVSLLENDWSKENGKYYKYIPKIYFED